MLQQRLSTEAGAGWVGAAYEHKQMRKMVVTLALLVLSLAVVLIRDHSFWFGADDTPGTEQAAASPAPNTVAPPAVAVIAPAKKAIAVPVPVAPSQKSDVRKTDTGLKAHSRAPATINSVKVEPQLGKNAAEPLTPWAPATTAAERVRINETSASQRQPLDVSYPLLAQQMKVEGSVVLQVLIGADGIIQSMRVLSGPPILATAAREAVRNWRFRPYLQNGQPVETSATVTVNLTIRVLDNTEKTTAASSSVRIVPGS